MFAFHRFQKSFFSNENQKTQRLGPGKVYGEILSGGKTPTVSIRENLLFYGAGVALLLAFLWHNLDSIPPRSEGDLSRKKDLDMS